MILVEVIRSLFSLLVRDQFLKKAIPMALQFSTSPSLSWERFSESPTFSSKRLKETILTEKDCVLVRMVESDATLLNMKNLNERRVEKASSRKEKKRPVKIEIPKLRCVGLDFGEGGKKEGLVDEGFEAEGKEYWLACRKGTRHAMEDGYGVMTNINGDSKQALFGVFDGHGGRAAVDFVCQKLGKNVVAALAELRQEDEDNDDGSLDMAVTAGYLATDREFLSLQGVRGGACVATVLLRAGEIVAANVGDCRVVLSKKGIAEALTTDHRAGKDDERIRIEDSGGYVSCRNGVWRVQDSLAVSRAIGDESMKEWVISEPETTRMKITQDCEFIIIASDGLWDQVSNQEAVDIVLRNKKSIQSCKVLVDLASSRGSRDDITVMVVDLQNFVAE